MAASKQASKQASIHTHVHNAVMLVWGSLRLVPIIHDLESARFAIQGRPTLTTTVNTYSTAEVLHICETFQLNFTTAQL